jgi:hypothetical protein
MGKLVHADVLDAALKKVSGAALTLNATNTTITFCSSQPAAFANIAAAKLCSKTGLTAASYTIGAGTGTNRKVTCPAANLTGMVATAGAPTNALWAVIDDGTTLLACTAVTPFSVTSGGTYNANDVVYEIAQPT